MYGKFSSFTAKPGLRDELIEVLVWASPLILAEPGAQVNQVSRDLHNDHLVHVYNVYDSKIDYDNARAKLGDKIGAKVVPLLDKMTQDVEFEVAA